MRYFLYTYASIDNYQTTRAHSVFGAPKDGGDHLATKVKRLHKDDVIIFRNGALDRLYLFPYCAVAGPLYDQDNGESPWTDLLWRDEQIARRVIYHLRCAVDFENVPQLSLSRLTWDTLDALNFTNVHGRSIRGIQAWGQKFSGNFIEDEKELARFNELVEFDG